MKKQALIFGLCIALLSSACLGAQVTSSNYSQVIVTSQAGETNVSSTNYVQSMSLIDLIGKVISNSFTNMLGFFYATTENFNPGIKASLDDLSPGRYRRVNMTANVTDETGLKICQFIDNQTLPDGAKNYYNKSVTGISDQCSQNYTIKLAVGNVINFTVIVNDTTGNVNWTQQIITVSANVYNCTTLDTANTVYTMTKNASSAATCMYIEANNVTLDCNGMYINFSQSAVGYGVNITGFNFTTVKNCQIWQADIESEPEVCIGFYMSRANNNSVYRSTIVTRSWNSGSFYLNGECSDNAFFNNTVTSKESLAFYLRVDSHQNSIYNNNITCEGGTDGCIFFNGAERNLVYDNLINISGNANRGISIYQASYENQIYHNRIITNGIKSHGIQIAKENWLNQVYGNNITALSSSGSYAIYLSKGINSNIIFRNTISSLSCGIALNGTNDDSPVAQPLIYNLTFINNTIVPCSSGCSPNYFDILLTGNVTDIFFINNSFNKSRIGFIANSPGMPIEKKNLTFQWYLMINVTNSSNDNPIQNAWVTVNDSFARTFYNGSTDSKGGIRALTVTEFTMNGTVPFTINTDTCIDVSTNENITCFTPYNISVNLTSYYIANRSIDVNKSRFVIIRTGFSDTYRPQSNASINNSMPKINEVVNVSANVSDDYGLRACQFVTNRTGIMEYFNTTISGMESRCSQNFTITVPRGNVINFSVIAFDMANNTNQSDFVVTVVNTLPPQVTLLSPLSNNYTINRTPEFAWQNVTDADGDRILFNLYIECIACSIDNRDLNTSNINYSMLSGLQFLGDDGYYYNWSVRAIDNSSNGETSFGAFSSEWNITIESFLSINFSVKSVNFGSLAPNQVNTTETDTPGPLVIENDGNVFANISVYAKTEMWEKALMPTDKFQYKIANTTELFSFNWTESRLNWTNFTSSANLSIIDFSYLDANDTAEIDIRVQAPDDEGPGAKQSQIVLTAMRSR